MRLSCGLILCLLATFAGAQSIDAALDLKRQGELAKQQHQIFLLYVSRPDCPYCAELEQAVLLPMLKDPVLMEKIYLAELSWTAAIVTDFNGQRLSADEIVRRFDVIGTPTLLFLDSNGQEIAERLVGYPSADFYWFYFERTIETAWSVLSSRLG